MPTTGATILPVNSYQIYWDQGVLADGSYVLLASINSYNQNFYNATNLVMGTLYNFKVSAINDVGEGDKSAIITSYAKSLPGQPIIPYLSSSTKTSSTTADVTISWYPIVDTGGVPLEGYNLY